MDRGHFTHKIGIFVTKTGQSVLRIILQNNEWFQRIPRKLKAITPNKTNIEFGHSGLECFKLFSRTRFYEHVGFAFLVRRVPKSDWKTDPYDLVSVEDVGNEEGKNKV